MSAARRVAIAVVAGVLGGLTAHFGRGYEPRLALVTGLAVALLAFAILRTVDRIRHQHGARSRR